MQSLIPVQLPQQSYNIAIQPGGLDQLGAWMAGKAGPGLAKPLGKKVLLVSNAEIFAQYGDRALASLSAAGFDVAQHLIPTGEEQKHLGSIQAIYDSAIAHKIERSSSFVALGGGVVGDMTGFAAASWLRGVNFIQVPTTLLAMVDASIGGKTGVNHPRGKNLIGAFYQPQLVFIDPATLKTLPPREFRAGMAEVIKYGIICSQPLFEALEASDRLDDLSQLSDDLLNQILAESCGAKAKVVSQDEREGGIRAILNYGHTIGHAVENLMQYKDINHGEAVAIGMVAAGALGVKLGSKLDLWDEASQARQVALIRKTGLPTQLPANLSQSEAREAIVAALQNDKKVQAGQVRFILPRAIGEVIITDEVPAEAIREVLAAMVG
jgi:3-dehydroquinate synthase